MSSYNEQMQKIVSDYQKSGEPWPTTAKYIAGWAIRKGFWKPQDSSIISQCSDHIARAMRDEYIIDPQGRRVRAKHVAKISENGEQQLLWADIRSAPRIHMELAFQQRRQQIVGDCHQLKVDADSYNENASRTNPIQIVFDFTLDLEEIERAERRLTA